MNIESKHQSIVNAARLGIGNICFWSSIRPLSRISDSVFFTFNLEDPKTKQPIRGQKALEITIEIAQDAAHLCSEFLKPPMDSIVIITELAS